MQDDVQYIHVQQCPLHCGVHYSGILLHIINSAEVTSAVNISFCDYELLLSNIRESHGQRKITKTFRAKDLKVNTS